MLISTNKHLFIDTSIYNYFLIAELLVDCGINIIGD